ncbi:TetR/AcrR family transcriptional regulator [Oceanobacillus sp. Castelsardo]|uniref:TetR/AcrR family transcriptional regulator n=1 Tax=Oceanobacillus sp. Castelsardo TaxID=1851204 RepID=UPI000838B48C|nr:TetR/AcrR family transcriptional regulator [Oceanobacillus sp. Castelsardo]
MNQKEKQIMDAAQKLFIIKGFRVTSIQDILREAKIAKGTFYNYFNSKNECLMAILDSVNEEIKNERMKLVFHEELDDETVFIKQVDVRFKMDKKHNLMALFHSIPISDDEDLKKFMEKHYKLELEWIANRLVDLYGAEISNHALDHAISLLGILQQGMYATKLFKMEMKKTEDVIKFALQRMKQVIQINQSDTVFFTNDYLHASNKPKDCENYKEVIIIQLRDLMSTVQNKKIHDYLQFLLEELQEKKPRLYLIESVLESLQKELKIKDMEFEGQKISQLVWRFMERWKNENSSTKAFN